MGHADSGKAIKVIREKLYRDPIHDLIALDKNSHEDCTLIELIDAPEIQRLRRIRQLGLASLAYQGAEHSRFTHSIGAMWVATRIITQLNKERVIPPRVAFATRCAALLHDIGHGPLSHVFEKFMGVHHERWTRDIILSHESVTHHILARHHASLPGEVVAIIEGRSHPPFLSQIISSQLDADRFDYLLRDSVMTGVKYGIYDFERLLHVLRLDPRGENIVVAPNGIQPVEKYLQSRYHMYSQVYLHKTVRAGETAFEKLLLRASDLAKKNALPALHADEPFARLLKAKDKTLLEDYLQLDDDVVYASLQRWRKCDDDILCDLANRVIERRIFKTLDVSKVKGLAAKAKLARLAIREAGLDPRYYFAIDTSGDVPYRPYDPRIPSTQSHIMVEPFPGGSPCRDIHELSEVVAGLARAAFTIKRAMFPESANGIDLRRRMSEIFLDHAAADGFLPRD
ncbi:MAG: HD domain-containing protein [Candidatus Sumerlaeaceae bacterium]